MAIVNDDFLTELRNEVKADFEDSVGTAMSRNIASVLAMRVDAMTETVKQEWMGTIPQLASVENQGPVYEDLENYTYSLSDVLYGSHFDVKRKWMEDDNLGMVSRKAGTLGARAAQHVDKLIFEAAASGDSEESYTGSSFFNNSHTIGRASVDNIVTGNGTTSANLAADLATAASTMFLYQDDQGEPIGLTGRYIMCHPSLRQTWYSVLFPTSAKFATTEVSPPSPPSAAGGFEEGGYRVIVNPYLTDTNDWYLMTDDFGMRPFVLQWRDGFNFYGPTGSQMPDGTPINLFKYGVDGRYAVGYGDPRTAIKVTNT